MTRFQMKYGVALIYAGLLAFALDRGHTLQLLLPACVGRTREDGWLPGTFRPGGIGP